MSRELITPKVTERGLERFLGLSGLSPLVEIKIGDKSYLGLLSRRLTKISKWNRWEYEVVYFFLPSYYNMRVHKVNNGEMLGLPVVPQESHPYYRRYKKTC
ncbi:MAG: hypothetical protein AAB922_07090 [Patescibacteria group bacterium]